MSETTNPGSALEKEHLNKIIAVLIEQNDGLKMENKWLKIRIGLTEQGKSNLEIGNAFEEFWKSNEKIVLGLTEPLKSNHKKVVGLSEEWKSNEKTEVGLSELWKSDHKIDVGHAELLKSYEKTGVGLPEVLKSHAQIGVGQTELLEPLPKIINPDGLIISALVGILTASGFRYVEKSTLRNAAALMIHFYNKGDGAYPELRKVTILSTGGISKFMTSMRKRGLIQRYAYKKYELTAHGMNLLKQAYSKVKK